MKRILFPLGLYAVAAVLLPTAVMSQGSLTPAGAPGPTFKTLDQIEPRTPIQSLPAGSGAKFVISRSGAYYLTEDISIGADLDGISVEAENVSIDLNGCTLVGQGSGTRGIVLRGTAGGLCRVRVFHGRIQGFGAEGILSTSVNLECRFALQDVHVGCGRGVSLPAGQGNATRVSVRGGASGLDVLGHAEACDVSQVTGSGLIGIRASTVAYCRVGTLTGTDTVTGIAAVHATQSSVGSLFGGTAATGFACPTGTVDRCMVSVMGLVGPGQTTGITAKMVENCHVERLGIPNSGTPTGIIAEQVRGCRVVTFVGSGGVSVGIRGGEVVQCSVEQASATAEGAATGIQGTLVADCVVGPLTGNGNIIGIDAQRVTGCQASATVVFSATGEACAIRALKVSHCLVLGAVSQGGMPAVGIEAPDVESSRIRGIVLAAVGGGGTAIGISGPSGHNASIRSCTVSNQATEGIRIAGSGQIIDCTVDGGTTGFGFQVGLRALSSGARIENNTLRRCTTGVMTSDSATSVVVRNVVTGATTPFSVGASVKLGPVASGPGAIATTSPWANFVD